jgi:hypothetical protein
MAIRIVEYAFLVARQFATWDIGHATIPMPYVSVIYIKKTERTPKTTSYTFTFPTGESVTYESENVILADLTKEYILEKRMFAYIPFYIARYENALTSIEGAEQELEQAAADLEYFKDGIAQLYQKGELVDDEFVDLMKFVNTIIEHITNGNQNEGRMVEVMGGVILETESERLRREGKEQILFSLVQDGIITMEEAAKRASQNEGKMVRVMGGVILETESERLRREGREQGREEGREQILFGLVKDGLITLEEAAKRANMTEISFEESMKRFEA